MSATGILSTDVGSQEENLWQESWTKIDIFAPQLKMDFQRITTQQDSPLTITVQQKGNMVSSV